MKDILIILVMCVAALAVGAYLFFSGPKEFTNEVPDQSAGAVGAPVVGESVPFRALASGANAAEVTSRRNIAVRDAEEFARVWSMAYPGGEAVPAIDFSKEYVIAAFAGEKPTGGYAIEVSSVTDLGETRTVTVRLTRPGEACVVTDALTSPFVFIVVPASTADHKAVDAETVTSCS